MADTPERRTQRDRRRIPRDTDRRVRRAEAVSAEDAARLMDVSRSTIIRLIRTGKLPATRLGRQWRILLSSLRRGTIT